MILISLVEVIRERSPYHSLEGEGLGTAYQGEAIGIHNFPPRSANLLSTMQVAIFKLYLLATSLHLMHIFTTCAKDNVGPQQQYICAYFSSSPSTCLRDFKCHSGTWQPNGGFEGSHSDGKLSLLRISVWQASRRPNLGLCHA